MPWFLAFAAAAFAAAARYTAAGEYVVERTPVHGVSFSPDGRRLAAAGEDRRVRVWELSAPATAALILDGHEGRVTAVAYSPDGSLLASAGMDDVVRLWDGNSGEPLAVLRGHERWVNALAWSPDGRLLASGGADRSLRVWDPATGAALRVIEVAHGDWVLSLAWSPDGRSLASGGADNALAVWDAASWRRRLLVPAHGRWVTSVAWGQGERLYTGSLDGSVRTWDAASGKPLEKLLGGESWVLAVAASPDGRRLAAASFDGTVRLWEAARERRLPQRLPWAAELAWSPDGRRLAVGSRFESEVQIWDAGALARVAKLKLPSPGAALVNSLAFADGLLAASQDGGQVSTWDPASGRLLSASRPYGESTDGVAFAPGGGLVVAGHGQPLRLLDPAGKVRAEGFRAEVLALAPDGRTLAAAAPGEIRLLRLPELTEVARSTLPRAEVHALAFDPAGGRLALAWERGVRVWEPGSGWQVDHPGEGIRRLAFLNKDLLAAAGTSIQLLEPGGASRILEPERSLAPEFAGFEPRTLAAAGPGGLLACGWVDRSVALYDASGPGDPRLLERFSLGPGRQTTAVDRLTALGFLPGGTLVGGSVDGIIWLRERAATRELRAPPTPPLHD